MKKKLKLLALILSLFLVLARVGFCAPATMYVTPAGDGDNSGDSWANAMSLSDWESDCEVSAEAGDIYYVAGGTYTLTNDFSCPNDGVSTSAIKIIGVKSGTTAEPPTASDWAYTTDRPLINCSAYQFTLGDYWWIMNLQGTSTDNEGFKHNARSLFYNVKVTNSSASAGRDGLRHYSYTGYCISCEGISTNGDGIDFSYGSVINSYAHDSNNALRMDNGVQIIASVFDSSTVGINLADNGTLIILFNTIYGNTTGLSGTTSNNSVYLNNIISDNTTGASWGTAEAIDFWDFNVWNNDTDTNNVTMGANAIIADPLLNNPASGDFTLQSGSPAIGAANGVGAHTGATGDYKWNIGADQDDNAAGEPGSSVTKAWAY